MILKNKRDREAFLREVSLESLKKNTLLLANDIVQLSNGSFYKIVTTTTSIPLDNGLFAQSMPVEIVGNVSTADKLKTPRTISLGGDVTGSANFDGSANVTITATVGNDSHSHSNSTITSLDASKVNTGVLNTARIPNLDASKITTGTIDIARLPAGALERLVEVADDTARFKLTKAQVQLGDVVKVTNTLKMYKVINENSLNTESGYTVFLAGRAAEVPWSGVTGKPSTMPNPQALTISLNGTSQGAYDGSAAKAINVTAGSVGAYTKGEVDTKLNGKANASHTHTKSQITDFPTSMKNPTSLTVQANGTTLDTYDGSVAKTVNLTATNVGAYTKAETQANFMQKFKSTINKTQADNVNLADGFYNVQDTLIAGQGGYYNLLNWGFYSSGSSGAKAQLAIPYQFSDPKDSSLFIRVGESATWKTPWRKVWTDGNFNPATKSDTGHTHDDRYFTEAEINNKLAGKANTSHGTHIPTPQTANNKVYLRNDNTWHTITPAEIGAQPAGSYAASSHNHSSANITSLSGYTKPASGSPIAASDSLNTALGKLEAQLGNGLGMVRFYIQGNDLMMEYSGSTAPKFSLNQADGCMYFTF